MENLTNNIIRRLYNIKNESPEYTDLIRLVVKALKRVCELDVALKNVQKCVYTLSHDETEEGAKRINTTYYKRQMKRKQPDHSDKSAVDKYSKSQSENEYFMILRSDCYWYFN